MNKTNKKLLIVTIVAVVLAISCVIGTIAFLAVKTPSITNTFVSGDISLTLNETTGNTYNIIPGATLNKDPKITVGENSEDCYVFVKIDESSNFDKANVYNYTVADGWIQLEIDESPVAGVYYRDYTTTDSATEYAVISGNTVTVKNSATTQQMADATNATLTFTAYAVQKEAGDVEAAWAVAQALA